MINRIQLEPEAQAFAEAEALSPLLFTLGPEQGRLALDEAQSGRVRKHPVDMEDLTITDGLSVQLALRILRPQNARTPLPVIVYIHGAGWVFGSTQTHDRLVRELAVGAGAAVVIRINLRTVELGIGEQLIGVGPLATRIDGTARLHHLSRSLDDAGDRNDP